MAKVNSNTDTVMSTASYVVATILMSLPLVGLVIAIVWAFVSCDNRNKRNYARAYLIFLAVGVVLSLLFIITSGVFMSMFSGLFDFF